jgi:hypothetical protein
VIGSRLASITGSIGSTRTSESVSPPANDFASTAARDYVTYIGRYTPITVPERTHMFFIASLFVPLRLNPYLCIPLLFRYPWSLL